MNFFIPMLDAPEANLRRRAIVYSDTTEMYLFLAYLKATMLEIVLGVRLLEEVYPKDGYLKLTDELLHFHLYMRQVQSQGQRTQLCSNLFPCLMETFIKLFARKKFTLPFLMWKQY